MNSRRVSIAASVLCQAAAYATVSSEGPGYTMGFLNNAIYSINLQTGANFTVTTIPGSAVSDIALLNKNTAYVLGGADGNVYAVNLQNGSYTRITPTPLPISGDLFAIAMANNSTAYVAAYASNTVYSVNLQTGAISSVATVPGNPGLTDIAMLNSTTAYAVGYNDNQIYSINLQTGASSVVATIPGNPLLEGIALATSTTAYVVGNSDGTVRVVDLQTGASSIVATISGGPALENIAINNTTAYTVGDISDCVYVINLLNGSYSILAVLPPGVELNGMAILLQMPTLGLHGNNQQFANYLNANAPIDVIRSFALLNNGLQSALESAAPTRNAFATYASQNAYLAASQAFSDHLRHKRFHGQLSVKNPIALADHPYLLADATDTVRQKEPSCSHRNPCAVWLAPFGEYAREKPQNDTPAFTMGLGGAAAAFEYTVAQAHTVGFGGAYAYTHVHEENGAGHANVNQGFLTAYGTLNAAAWYFDLGIWGGYYHTHNQRNISFPGVDETATSNTNGWQLAPHFEVGYNAFRLENCGMKWFGVEPFLMADWVANWEQSFKEHGAPGLNMGQKGRFCSLLRGESGLRLHEIAEFNWGRLVFREKGSYAYQKTFRTGTITSFLIGSSGSFVVDTLTGGQNLGIGEFSMLVVPANAKAPYIDLRYQGEFGSKYQSHQGMFEIGKTF